MARSAWTDLLDPDEEQLREHVPRDLRRDAWQELLRPADEHGVIPRPTIKSHGELRARPPARRRGSARGGPRLLPGSRLRPHAANAWSPSARRRAHDRRSSRANIAELCDAQQQRGVAGNDRVLPHRRHSRALPRPARRHPRGDRRDRGGASTNGRLEEVRRRHRGPPARPPPHPEDTRADARRRPRDRRRPGRHRRPDCCSRARFSLPRSSVSSRRRTTSSCGPARRSSSRATCSRPFATTSRPASAIDQNEVDEEADGDRLDRAPPDLHRRASTVRTSTTCPSSTGASGTPASWVADPRRRRSCSSSTSAASAGSSPFGTGTRRPDRQARPQ